MTENDPRIEAAIARLLSEDGDLAELGIESTCENEVVVLRGDVNTTAHRDLIADRVAAAFPDVVVRNEISVLEAASPTEPEDLR